MKLPTDVKLVEVGPRDGLQNEKQIITTDTKVEFINHLSETGLKSIEVTSFVSPKWIPQIADNVEVFSKITKKNTVDYSVLVPNLKGLEKAIEADVKEIAVFIAASETFSMKNINCSITKALEQSQAVVEKAKDYGIKVRGYISCVMGCPYEGKVELDKVRDLAGVLYDMGCYEISLGDTIGVGTAYQVKLLIEKVSQVVPLSHLAVHFHDTYGQALTNIFSALEEGIHIVDASVAGLGGCPYAKGSSGNVASEDVVYLLHGLGIYTGIDLVKLCKAGIFISNYLNRPTYSKTAKALAANHFEFNIID